MKRTYTRESVEYAIEMESLQSLADRAKRQREIEIKQANLNWLVKYLKPQLDLGHDAAMRWLRDFTENADDIGVNINQACGVESGGYEFIAKQFEAAGYKENDLVGAPREEFESREGMARYIAGQCINFFLMGMPPHPVTISFIVRYFAQ